MMATWRAWVVMVLLGLDVSIIGLIQIPTSSLYLVVELAGLTVVLAASFALGVIALAWSELGAAQREDRDGP